MKNLGGDIFIINNGLPESLIDEINSIIDKNYEKFFSPVRGPRGWDQGKLPFYQFGDTFKKVIEHWDNNIEENFLDNFFSCIKKPAEVEGYKNYIKTRWRDMDILLYNNINTYELEEHIHCDFSPFTFVCGLNSDYEGSELVFPRQSVEIKIGRGDLVIFPGWACHPHGVKKIISGERRVLVGHTLAPNEDHRLSDYL